MDEIDTKEIRSRLEKSISRGELAEIIYFLCDALDACRKERDEAKAREATAMLALEKACARGSYCPEGEFGCQKDLSTNCSQCGMEHLLQQAAEELAERGRS